MARNRKQIMSLISYQQDRPSTDSQSHSVSRKRSTRLLPPPTNKSLDTAGTYKRKQNADSYCSSLGPKMDQQISVISTDSGFLPKDIQDSSFVDDVIDELNSKGISHFDLISYHDCPQSYQIDKELLTEKSIVMKDTLQLWVDPETSVIKKQKIEQSKKTNTRRQKNNESSRRSRASRKKTTQLKEVEVANLEAENRRLSILLSDFNAIAANCKQWIVKKMESD